MHYLSSGLEQKLQNGYCLGPKYWTRNYNRKSK